MADIRKKLIISGEIDGSFKRELEQFAKQISKSFSMGKFDTRGLKDAATALSQAAKELKAVVGSIKSGINVNVRNGGPGGVTGGGGRGPASMGGQRGGVNQQSTIFERPRYRLEREVSKAEGMGVDPSQIKAFKEKVESAFEDIDVSQSTDQIRLDVTKAFDEIADSIKASMDRVKQSQIAQEQAADEASKASLERIKQESMLKQEAAKATATAEKQAAKSSNDLIKKQASEEKRIQQEKTQNFKNLFQMAGMDQRTAGRFGSLMSGGTGGFGKAAGLMKGVGIASAGALAISKAAEVTRNTQVMLAQRRQAFGTEALNEGTTSAMVGESGRNSLMAGMGALGGAAKWGAIGAGAGAVAGMGALSAPLAGIGGLLGAAYGGVTGYMSGGAEEAQRRKDETALSLQSTSMARQHRGGRLGLMRGGASGGSGSFAINQLERAGVGQGFTAQETVQQGLGVKGALGRQGLGSLTQMQQMTQVSGLSPEQQAQAAQAMISTGQGKTAGNALQMQEMMMRKAIAAGFDQSKAGKAMITTVEYAAASQGMGEVDLNKINQQMMNFVSGATGGTRQATDQDLERAQQLQQMLKSESTSTKGLSGLGNFMQVQEALGPDASTEQFVAAMGMSNEATEQDMQKLLGTEAGSRLFKSRQKGTQSQGAEALGLGYAGQVGFGGRESGLTSEQFMGKLKLQGGQASGALPELDKSILKTVEFGSAVHDAKINATALQNGFLNLNTEVKNSIGALKSFNDSLKAAQDKLQEYTGSN